MRVSASGEYDAKIAVLRQLLAWERDLAGASQGLFDDRIYVLTPMPPSWSCPRAPRRWTLPTAVHTSLGHRCRGARVDGAMVPLNTPLQNGQTVEITTAKEGGPSRDWLNAELGFLASHRAKAKVRAWFNAQVRTKPWRAAARRWKSCCSAKARRRCAGGPGGAAGLQVGRRPV
jgi:GTP pyrophosphokinase